MEPVMKRNLSMKRKPGFGDNGLKFWWESWKVHDRNKKTSC